MFASLPPAVVNAAECFIVSALVATASFLSPGLIPCNTGLDNIETNAPHLPRAGLVEALYDKVLSSRIVHISAPMGSGKSSLLNLFYRAYSSQFECLRVSLVDMDPVTCLAHCGVMWGERQLSLDLKSKCEDHIVIIMMDDCQRRYESVYNDFWTELVKNSAMWMHTKLRFVMSATRSLSRHDESPVDFDALPHLGRNDLLLTADESFQLLCLPAPTGLNPSLNTPVLRQIIVNECSGLVASLRISVNILNDEFRKLANPSEDTVLRCYFSHRATEGFGRCFIAQPDEVPEVVKPMLVRMLTASVSSADCSGDEKNAMNDLVRAGVLVSEVGTLQFASPLASRVITNLIFPGRATCFPNTLADLVVNAVTMMSATSLQHSVVTPHDTPKEAVYQHLLMRGLHSLTPPSSSVCPELSRVFQVPGEVTGAVSRIAGELDFYIDGDLRWGIELLVNGAGVGEHINRFAEGGKYFPLRVKDYLVVDFRVGNVTNVQRHAHRMTCFFHDNFTRCSIVQGTTAETSACTLCA